jgi:DNA-binding GntR family transcriptional regulator
MARPRSAPPPAAAVRPAPPALRPVSRDSIQDRIYAELSDALMCGRLQGGQTLQIRDLATTFQTSVMPVREALRRLVAEGALESSTQRPVRVPPISMSRLDDIYQARLMVEGRAAELAALHADEALLAALSAADDVFSQAVDAQDVDAELQSNQVFHHTLYEAAQSPTLMAIIRSLWLQSGPYVRLAVEQHRTGPAEPRSRFHHELVDALRAHDPAAARRALEGDLSWAWQLLKENAATR